MHCQKDKQELMDVNKRLISTKNVLFKCFMCHDSTLPQTFAKPFNFQHQEGSCQSKKYSDHVWIKKCLQKLAYIFFSNAKISAKLHLLPVKMVWLVQKQPSRGAVRKRCSKNMQQFYRKTPMEVAK